MNKLVNETLTRIVEDLIGTEVSDRNNLLIDKLILLAEYSSISKKPLDNYLIDGIERLCANGATDYFFWGGLAGQYAFYLYLKNKSLISTNDYFLLTPHREKLKEYSINEIRNGNYDFLYGGTGIAYYLAMDNVSYDLNYFDRIFTILSEKSGYSFYDLDSLEVRENEIHIGIPHGIIGILKLCVFSFSKGIHREKTLGIATKILNFLFEYRNQTYPYYSCVIKNSNSMPYYRLAWCYGDLGANIVILYAGKILNRKDIVVAATKALIDCSIVRQREDAKIYDACMCHGSSGAAYIFRKAYIETGNKLFNMAYTYWLKETILFAKHDDGIGGYKSYSPSSQLHTRDTGLLEGASGIGLLLATHFTNSYSWEYTLMLND